MTLLQMTGMYQAIANDGMRIPPRIVKATIAADGSRYRGAPARTVSGWSRRRPRAPCATCCGRSFSATRWALSRAPAPAAAVEGYQIAGKTGTAQQINPGCGCYYDDVYWITFAGMAPVDDPRYVIGIMMDAPDPQRRRHARPLGRAAVPQHRRLAAAARERPALAGPRPAADPAGRLRHPDAACSVG